MEIWWMSLNVMQKIYFCIGLAATVLLIAQIVLMLFGLGDGGDVDIDLDGDGVPDVSVDASDGFNVFTLRGLTAFFAIGGWVGYTLADDNITLAVILSLVSGTIALLAMAFVMKALMKTRSDGNIDIAKSVGKTAEVYLTVPPAGKGYGKINLTLEERFVEINAQQKGETPISTGAQVKVVSAENGIVTVEPL